MPNLQHVTTLSSSQSTLHTLRSAKTASMATQKRLAPGASGLEPPPKRPTLPGSKAPQRPPAPRDYGLEPSQKRPKLPGFSSSFQTTICLTVGLERASFLVHEDLICHHSSLIRDLCSISEAMIFPEVTTIPLPKAGRFAMQYYLEWLYTKRSELASIIQNPTSNSAAQFLQVHDWEDTVDGLCDLWVLGAYLGDAAFQNQVMDSLVETESPWKGKVGVDTIETIVEEANPESALGLWLIDHLVGMSTEKLTSFKSILPKSMIEKLLERYVEVTEQGGKVSDVVKVEVKKNRCKYHEHAQGDKKCERKLNI